MLQNLKERNSELNNLRILTKSLNKESRVLDVGCGMGKKLVYMTNLGFNNIVGVDINPQNVAYVRSKGQMAYVPDELEKVYNQNDFDLVIFSHVVEHFQYSDLKCFIEKYLYYIKEGALIYISTPTLYSDFYDDFDHVKPYSHLAFLAMFSDQHKQIQYQSDCNLELLNIYFRKAPLRLRSYRSLYIKQKRVTIPRIINKILQLLFRITLNEFGKTTGWQALFAVNKNI